MNSFTLIQATEQDQCLWEVKTIPGRTKEFGYDKCMWEEQKYLAMIKYMILINASCQEKSIWVEEKCFNGIKVSECKKSIRVR